MELIAGIGVILLAVVAMVKVCATCLRVLGGNRSRSMPNAEG